MSNYTIKLGQSWVGIDHTGIMAWYQPHHRNYSYIWNTRAKKVKAYLFGVLLTTLLLGAVKLVVVIARDYHDRMIEYNAHVCAVYGKQPDCKTPLNKEGNN